jgi:hypothetical protein
MINPNALLNPDTEWDEVQPRLRLREQHTWHGRVSSLRNCKVPSSEVLRGSRCRVLGLLADQTIGEDP